jgi:phenylalanyl-tRNA synthetase alpha chain
MRQHIIINNEKEEGLLDELARKTDIQSERIKRLLALPDLTKKEHSPVKIIVDHIMQLPRFADFDVIDIPRIVTVEENFDVLNAPADHPSRRETDTYYVSEDRILRTQMTAMWPYYLRDKNVLERLEKEGFVASLSPGIVFRKDEIDKKHFPAFHQIDFLYICKKDKKVITQKDLEDVQADCVKSIFGQDIEFRFLVDSFPFTDPSIQVEIKFNDQWMEVTGAGLVHTQVLKNFGLDPQVYNGWAFSFGIERLAMRKMNINDIRIFWSEDPRITSQFKDINSNYKEVSKYPPVTRDISFIISKSVNLNNYYELVRDQAGDLVEEVQLADQYENDEKFGTDKKSYTFHIVYRSLEKTLTDAEVNSIHDKIIEKTKEEFSATIR